VYTDPEFTSVFTMEILHGSADLKDKSTVLISDRLAKTYFDSDNVQGRQLTQIIAGEPKEYVIGGIFKAFPSNSSFRFDLMTTYDNYFSGSLQKDEVINDWKKWTTTLLRIDDTASVKRVERALAQYVKPQNEAREDLKAKYFYLESFAGMAQRAVRAKMDGHWFNMPMPPAGVIAPFIMAGFLLLVACFNFTNNAIALAGKRLKEIGIRKVIGGRKKELILQFLAESFIFCFLAAAISLVIGEYVVKGWDAMWPGIELSVNYSDNIDFLLVLATLLTVTALLAGAYPAFYISSFQPIAVLKGTTKFGRPTWVTRSLLAFQFSISLAAVIFAIAFFFNSRFQKEFDLGYDYHAVVQVPVENESQYTTLANALGQNSLVQAIGGAEHHIYNSSYQSSAQIGAEKKQIDVLNVGDGYFEAVNVRVLAGRAFIRESASDIKDGVIVNEEFVRYFNLADAIGKRVLLNDTTQLYIVGVVKDVYLRALFQPLAPIAFRYAPKQDYRYLVASSTGADVNDLNKAIAAEWKKLFPNSLYTGKLMEERMVATLEHFDAVVIMYTFLGIVVIIMSASGLYSIVSVNLLKRTKELGIRKILGASLRNLVIHSSSMVIVILLCSFVIGGALGTIAVNAMMDSVWEYYEPVNVKVLSIAIGMLLTVCVITVGSKIVAVVMRNPADSLRYE
jgi:putative ABC transport system permease protein